MLTTHLRRDSAVKLICLLILAAHGLGIGLTFEYFETFIFWPALAGLGGFVLGLYPPLGQEAIERAERAAEAIEPEFLLKMLAPLTMISLAGTTFVLVYDVYTGSFTRFQWWSIVLGMLYGRNVGELVRKSKREPPAA
jgi:hypothetical protein